MANYANVWPSGGLFAFSGLDGETCFREPFIASGAIDAIGWDFWLEPRVAVLAYANGTPLTATPEVGEFCFSDCWELTVTAGAAEGQLRGAFLDRASLLLSIQMHDEGEAVVPALCVDAGESRDHAERVFVREGCWLAIVQSEPAYFRSFGIALSYSSEAEALERARKALVADINAAIEARMRFYTDLRLPLRLTSTDEPIFYKAVSVIKVNIESAQEDIPCRWTTPDRMPHRRMWLWDSAFHSMGDRHLSPQLGEDAIRALLSKQQDNGKLSLAVHPGKIAVEEHDTQPPIVAWAVWKQFELSENEAFLEEAYPRLVEYLQWFEHHRKNRNGLYGWYVRANDDPIRAARGGESGMDNSPRFDNITSMTAVDLCSYIAAEYLAMKKMAKKLGYTEDVARWHRRQQTIIELTNELLWDDEDRFYYDLDADGNPIMLKTPAGLLALHGRIPDHDRAEALRTHLMNPKEFWTFFPVPSVARDEDAFSSDMWRGPTWLNINVLLFYALEQHGFLEEARLLARMTIDEAARWYQAKGCIFEYYDCLGEKAPPDLPRKGAPGTAGGVGFGVIADYHWSAAAIVDLLHAIC